MTLNLLLIGLAIALDPLPLMAFMVVLPSKHGVRKGGIRVRVAGIPGHRGHGHGARYRQ
jgi:hypothetical protein